MREDTPEKIGRRIKAARTYLKMNQTSFGKVCGVGKGAVSNWEKGLNEPDIDSIKPLKLKYGITLDYLIMGDASTLRHDLAEALAETESRIATRASKDRSKRKATARNSLSDK